MLDSVKEDRNKSEQDTDVPGRPVARSSLHRFAWARKLGVAGFLFFLLKGLAWLVVPVLVVRKAIE